MDLTVGVSRERTAHPLVVLVDDRVTLLNGVGLRMGVLNEGFARAREALLKGVAIVRFWTPVECVPLSYQHGRLTNEEKGNGGGIRLARFCSVSKVRLAAMLSGGRRVGCEAVEIYIYTNCASAEGMERSAR